MSGKRKPLILHVIGQLGRGGAERQLVLLTRNLQSRFRFVIVTYDSSRNGFTEDLKRSGGEVRILRKGRGVSGRAVFLARMVKLLKESSPDILHTWLISANFWARLAHVLSGGKCGVVSSVRSVNTSCVSLSNWIDLIFSPWTDAVITNTSAAQKLMSRFGISASKIHLIPNGIDSKAYDVEVSRESMRAELSIPQLRTVIGTVGRMMRPKNHVLFVKMARKLSSRRAPLHFVIVGEGELRPKLEAQIERYGLKGAFTLTGNRSDIPRVLRAFDLFVLTSTREGLPNAVMEAMSAGLPVVATAVGGVPELISDNVNGLLVASDDLEALVQKVELLLSNRQMMKRVGEAGRERMASEFSALRMSGMTEKLYDSLLRQSGFGGGASAG